MLSRLLVYYSPTIIKRFVTWGKLCGRIKGALEIVLTRAPFPLIPVDCLAAFLFLQPCCMFPLLCFLGLSIQCRRRERNTKRKKILKLIKKRLFEKGEIKSKRVQFATESWENNANHLNNPSIIFWFERKEMQLSLSHQTIRPPFPFAASGPEKRNFRDGPLDLKKF